MALSEERIAYYSRRLKLDIGFLTREHEPGFYTKVINFPAGYNRTNEEHIKWLIRDAREQLVGKFKTLSLEQFKKIKPTCDCKCLLAYRAI